MNAIMEKVALVTGSSSGIGLETSLSLARNGFHSMPSNSFKIFLLIWLGIYTMLTISEVLSTTNIIIFHGKLYCTSGKKP